MEEKEQLLLAAFREMDSAQRAVIYEVVKALYWRERSSLRISAHTESVYSCPLSEIERNASSNSRSRGDRSAVSSQPGNLPIPSSS